MNQEYQLKIYNYSVLENYKFSSLARLSQKVLVLQQIGLLVQRIQLLVL